ASMAARGLGRSANPLSGFADAAERLLAGGGTGHVATGSPECCVCPVCKAIAALRDPDPRLAIRLATGAADLAASLTDARRTLGRMGRRPRAPRAADGATATEGPTPTARATAAERPRPAPDPDVTWRMATAADSRDDDPEDRDPGDDPWHAATTAGT